MHAHTPSTVKVKILRRTTLPALLVALAHLGAVAQPLTNSGTCPTLARQSASWITQGDSRFLNADKPHRAQLTLYQNPGTIQVPLTAAQSINCIQTPATLKAALWASEADSLISIQNFTFDERGRMWAIETFDYPNNMLSNKFAGNDRIVILEDTNGDGKMDSRKVFVTGLNIPQAIELVPQGVAVGMSPHLVLFKDENGDDVADNAAGQILYTGFGNAGTSGDTHGGLQQLKYGLDGWLYGIQGYNAATVNGVASLASSIWRVRTDSTRIERVSGIAAGNSAGIGFMEDGQVFASGATGGGNSHSQHAALPGFPGVTSVQISDHGNTAVFITWDLVQGNPNGRAYTSLASHEFYTARLLPQSYWDRAAFLNEPTGHITAVNFLKRNNSTWTSTRDSGTANILASTDAWFAPIQSKVGPDGGVWVLDWYTYVMLHNGIESPGVNGAGAAWVTPLRNRRSTTTGNRVYRVVPSDDRLDPVLNLSNATLPQLVQTFSNTNMFWRLQAQRMILRKAGTSAAKAEVEPLLLQALKSRQRDTLGVDPIALHALWTAEGLGYFTAHPAVWDSVLKTLLLHPSEAVRANVPKAMPRTAASIQAIKEQGRVNDPDAQVRIATLVAMTQMPALEGIEMWTNYRTLDSYAAAAFSRVVSVGSGVTSVSELPAIPSLHAVVSVKQGGPRPGPAGRGPRFVATSRGWQPVADNQLVPGILSLYDLRGALVDRVTYDGAQWSSVVRTGRDPVYVYAYQGRGGEMYQGRIMP